MATIEWFINFVMGPYDAITEKTTDIKKTTKK